MMEIYLLVKTNEGEKLVTEFKEVWQMVKEGFITLEGTDGGIIANNLGKIQVLSVRRLTQKEKEKHLLRSFATEYQIAFADAVMTLNEIVMWQNFFEKYGRRYGLLREFRENGIC